jgi:hypothetical protein
VNEFVVMPLAVCYTNHISTFIRYLILLDLVTRVGKFKWDFFSDLDFLLAVFEWCFLFPRLLSCDASCEKAFSTHVMIK